MLVSHTKPPVPVSALTTNNKSGSCHCSVNENINSAALSV